MSQELSPLIDEVDIDIDLDITDVEADVSALASPTERGCSLVHPDNNPAAMAAAVIANRC
jgi:hypothetical protein